MKLSIGAAKPRNKAVKHRFEAVKPRFDAMKPEFEAVKSGLDVVKPVFIPGKAALYKDNYNLAVVRKYFTLVAHKKLV